MDSVEITEWQAELTLRTEDEKARELGANAEAQLMKIFGGPNGR